MAIELPPLPYADTALEPHITKQTLDLHHGKHHQAYVTNLNKLIAGTDLEGKDLEDIIITTDNQGIFNNAAQVYNHTFYWNCMKPNGGGKPTAGGELAKHIDSDLGGFDKFVEDMKNAAMTQFGSGWAWLVYDENKLKIEKTPNAENPIKKGQTPLLTIDVWEHAYYVDFQNRRPDYLNTFFESLVNWEFVEKNFAEAKN